MSTCPTTPYSQPEAHEERPDPFTIKLNPYTARSDRFALKPSPFSPLQFCQYLLQESGATLFLEDGTGIIL